MGPGGLLQILNHPINQIKTLVKTASSYLVDGSIQTDMDNMGPIIKWHACNHFQLLAVSVC